MKWNSDSNPNKTWNINIFNKMTEKMYNKNGKRNWKKKWVAKGKGRWIKTKPCWNEPLSIPRPWIAPPTVMLLNSGQTAGIKLYSSKDSVSARMVVIASTSTKQWWTSTRRIWHNGDKSIGSGELPDLSTRLLYGCERVEWASPTLRFRQTRRWDERANSIALKIPRRR